MKHRDYFTINGKQIKYSFRGFVAKRVGGLHNADLIFWRCREIKDKENSKGACIGGAVVRYISAGLKEGWFSVTSIEQDRADPKKIQAWIDKVILNIKPEQKPVQAFIEKKVRKVESITDIMKNIVGEIK